LESKFLYLEAKCYNDSSERQTGKERANHIRPSVCLSNVVQAKKSRMIDGCKPNDADTHEASEPQKNPALLQIQSRKSCLTIPRSPSPIGVRTAAPILVNLIVVDVLLQLALSAKE
jgi:hypothetical protein